MFRAWCSTSPMRRNLELEATIVEKYAAVERFLDERGRRIWAATESRAIGYGGDANEAAALHRGKQDTAKFRNLKTNCPELRALDPRACQSTRPQACVLLQLVKELATQQEVSTIRALPRSSASPQRSHHRGRWISVPSDRGIVRPAAESGAHGTGLLPEWRHLVPPGSSGPGGTVAVGRNSLA